MMALQAKIYQPLLAEVVRKEDEQQEGSHANIVASICAGNSEKARLAMQKHILGFWERWKARGAITTELLPSSERAIADAVDLLDALAPVACLIPPKLMSSEPARPA